MKKDFQFIFTYCTSLLVLSIFSAQSALALSTTTTRIGLVAGLQDNDVPLTPNIAGTDLGWVTNYGVDASNGGPLYQVILFGDAFYGTSPADVNHGRDDATAYVWAAGTSADSPLPAPNWAGWQDVGPGLEMGGARTPVGAAQFGGWEPWWALFIRGGTYATCSEDTQCNGLICDKSMGLADNGGLKLAWPLFYPQTPFPEASELLPCWRGANMFCPFVNGDINQGLCRDPDSPMADYQNTAMIWDPVDGSFRSERGKVLSLATVMQLGRAKTAKQYPTVPIVTNKFVNATMRATRSANDYRTANDPSNGNQMLWIWGRPSFWQKNNIQFGEIVSNAGNDLYLARMSKSAADSIYTANLTTAPLDYYAGNGQWSAQQADAKPVELVTPWQDGVSGHTAVTFVPGLNKWIMFYGGGTPALWDFGFGGELAADLLRYDPSRNLEGRVKMRVADHPWGPWSAPVDVLDRDDESICNYAWSPRGNACNEDATPAPWTLTANQEGALYGISIVDQWTQWNGSEITIGWFVSTFNPYKVHQMRTIISWP